MQQTVFLFVLVEEQNLLSGNLEDITIEGVTDVLNKRKDHPEAVLLFTVCLHHFVGSNLNYIYRELEHRFPDICFIRCYIIRLCKKHGLTPTRSCGKQCMILFWAVSRTLKQYLSLAVIFVLDENSDIKRLLKRYDYKVLELPGCKTWQELLDMSRGCLFIDCYPAGKYGMEAQAGRLGRKISVSARQF